MNKTVKSVLEYTLETGFRFGINTLFDPESNKKSKLDRLTEALPYYYNDQVNYGEMNDETWGIVEDHMDEIPREEYNKYRKRRIVYLAKKEESVTTDPARKQKLSELIKRCEKKILEG